MSEPMTGAQEPSSAWRRAALEGAVTVTVLAGAGVLAGLIWVKLWTPPEGVVSEGAWFPAYPTIEGALRDDFNGTGLYVAVAAVTGLVVSGALAYYLDRSELVTLVAVLAGSAVAAWLMLKVGLHYSPADPQVLAAEAADGTRLPSALRVSGRSPLVAFPVGALSGLMIVFLGTSRRRRQD